MGCSRQFSREVQARLIVPGLTRHVPPLMDTASQVGASLDGCDRNPAQFTRSSVIPIHSTQPFKKTEICDELWKGREGRSPCGKPLLWLLTLDLDLYPVR
jgi:hypothetical protein